ncbi:uncharacterized protein LOC143300476 [Babylonia areolata]|uniref:uncharacterized protein LOC143300476 n=1 Tax=Babylonia areolata TaxID=304850 RepID=UPI003FD3C3AA
MGVKDGFMGASMFMKVAFILLVVANLFSWIAFTTTSWGYTDNSSVNKPGWGLWRYCRDDGSACSLLDGTRMDWFASFQAFGIFGFVGLSVALLLVILFMFVGSCSGNGEVKMASLILCFVGGVCWLIAVIIFGAEFEDKGDNEFGFSFALAIIGLICAIVAGVLLIVDGKGGGGTSPA